AMTCAQLGLRFIAVMPEGVSNERSMMIRAYGGQTQLVPRDSGMIGCIERSRELAAACDGFLPRQFENADNADAHRFGTARELIEQMPGHCVDVVVSGVGTGGTLVGLYQGCRDMGCNVTPVLAKPVALSGRRRYEHGCFTDAECCSFSTCIPGVMDNMSKIFQPDQLEGLREVEVADDDALAMTRRLIALGFPVGPSSGLNMVAALEASRELDVEARVATVFPDRMERYFSTALFSD
ncbi:MAG: pyridoxal-phosphate dependent enzyme, partial [Rhodospirillales bacterium]|nr:pyridoxal-phosphate dependent enzyme [Rhodospirillales bacterium]